MLLFLRPLLRGQESCSCTSDIGAPSTAEESVHGIVSLLPTGVTIANDNTISFQEHGINIQEVSSCNQIQVTENNLTGYYMFSAFANILGNGIFIQHIPGACVLAPDVSGNHVWISNKFIGIGFGEVLQNALVDDNTVELTSDASPVILGSFLIPPDGIVIGTTDLVRVRHNSVSVNDEEIYDGTGISIGNSTNATVCDNTVDWMRTGLSFFQMCDNDIVRLNHMNNHDDGLFYYNGTMTGIQDNQGNEWNGTGGATHQFSDQMYTHRKVVCEKPL